MERETNQTAQATLCRSGCGFYGSPATDGLCSKCYKDALKRKQSPTGGVNSSASTNSDSNNVAGSSALSTASPTVQIATASSTSSLSSESSQEQQEQARLSVATEINVDVDSNQSESANGEASPSSDGKDQKSKTKRNRCMSCRKKVGLTGFECRCGGLYCCLHRYSDKHECTFDYKQLGAQEIRKNNPIIVSEKIQKL